MPDMRIDSTTSINDISIFDMRYDKKSLDVVIQDMRHDKNSLDVASIDKMIPDALGLDLKVKVDISSPIDSVANPDRKTYPVVTTIAGTGVKGMKNGPASSAQFFSPEDVAVDSTGVIYVADRDNHRIRMISKGIVSTLCGTGNPGFKDGPALKSEINRPRGIAVGKSGEVYFSEEGNHAIRRYFNGTVTTVAGTGKKGSLDGVANVASFSKPFGLWVTKAGEVLIVDSDNQKIRKLSNGKVKTVAGNGGAGSKDGKALSSTFYYPKDIVGDGKGKFFIADSYPHKIRVLEAGNVSTLAGTGSPGNKNGSNKQAMFKYPYGIAVDIYDNLYVADHNNYSIRKIAGGFVSTLAGDGVKGFQDGASKQARFTQVVGIEVSSTGEIIVADPENHRIRAIK